MASVFMKIVNMSISATWLVFAVLLIRLLLKKVPKWINVILWGIVGLRMIMPFSIESVFSLIPSSETISKAPNAPRPHFESGVTVVDNRVNDYLQGHYYEGVSKPTGHFLDITNIFTIIWIVGVVVLLAYTVISYLRVKEKVRTAVLMRENIFRSDMVVSPFVFGLIKPKIYLPFHMNEKDMELVIAHEQSHVYRKDYLWKPLGFLLLAIHWFNPIMWLGYVLLCRDIELACDEKVIREFDVEQKADYSQALLSCSVNRRMVTACPLAFGETSVQKRVSAVLNYRKPAFWLVALAIIISSVIAACFLTNPVTHQLKNIEQHELDVLLQEKTTGLMSDGETYQYIGAIPKELLQELFDIKISRREVSTSRSEGRDRSHTLVLNIPKEKDQMTSYVEGTCIHFNSDFSEVWINDGVKPTLSYKVKEPQKAEEIYNSITNNNASISTIGGADEPSTVITTVVIDELKAKFPMYFNLDVSKGLEVYIWQLAEGHYSCGLLAGKNQEYTQEELWDLHTSPATLDEMRIIVADYIANDKVTKSEVSIRAIYMPHSSYLYTIDDQYMEDLVNMFWSESVDRQETGKSAIIDTATFDIDGDGKDEQCSLRYGATSGVFTFVFSATENGKLEYYNIFSSPYKKLRFEKISFEENEEGKTMLFGLEGDKSHYMGIDVIDGNIVISSDEQEISYWGEQGVGSAYSGIKMDENGKIIYIESYPDDHVMAHK